MRIEKMWVVLAAQLYYENDTIQHAGVITGLGGVAGHSHKHYNRESYGYFERLSACQQLTAVTAACLIVKRELFEEVGGLNEENLKVAFNDVDFCLKIDKAGYRNIFILTLNFIIMNQYQEGR